MRKRARERGRAPHSTHNQNELRKKSINLQKKKNEPGIKTASDKTKETHKHKKIPTQLQQQQHYNRGRHSSCSNRAATAAYLTRACNRQFNRQTGSAASSAATSYVLSVNRPAECSTQSGGRENVHVKQCESAKHCQSAKQCV